MAAHRRSRRSVLEPRWDGSAGEGRSAPGGRRDLLRRGNRLPVASPSRALPELEYRPSLSPRVVAQRHLGAHRGTSRRRCPRARRPRRRTVRGDRRCPLGACVLDGEQENKGFDAGKKINGRKTFGIVDTLGLLVAVVVVAASISDNVGGSPSLIAPVHAQDASQSCGATPASRSPSSSTAAIITSAWRS